MTTSTEKAASLYREGRFREAFSEYCKSAEDGDVHAQVFLAWMYKTGCGTEKNENAALRWYQVAADGGYALAQDLLGFFYYEKSDFAEAARWYEKAASQGYLPAVWRMGRMYKTGKGVSVNKEKSFSLFEQASQNGHVFSKRDLAVMLVGGHHGLRGIPVGIGLFIISIFQLIRIAITSRNDERIRN